MGLLDHLWDDTVAGPQPEIGLGKLRKHQTFNFRSNSGKDGWNVRSNGEGSKTTEEAMRVTRSIMILKPPGNGNGSSDSPPVSPAGSTPPVSPFSGSRRPESFRFRRRSTSDAYEKASEVVGAKSARSPFDV